MDMIPIGSDLFEGDVISLTDFFGNLLDRERDSIGQQGFTVFYGKNNVVVGFIDVMVGMDDRHAPSLLLETYGFQTFLKGNLRFPFEYFSQSRVVAVSSPDTLRFCRVVAFSYLS